MRTGFTREGLRSTCDFARAISVVVVPVLVATGLIVGAAYVWKPLTVAAIPITLFLLFWWLESHA